MQAACRGAGFERGVALQLGFQRRVLGAAEPGEVQRVIQITGLREPTQRSYDAA